MLQLSIFQLSMLGLGHLHTGRALTGLQNPIPKSKPKGHNTDRSFFYLSFSIKAPPYKIKMLFSG